MGVTALAPLEAHQINPVLCVRAARLALPIAQNLKKRLLPNRQAHTHRAMHWRSSKARGRQRLMELRSTAEHENACFQPYFSA